MVPDDLLHDLDDAQRRAVTSPARPLAIVAPAGSGKTRVLTRRIGWRVATGDADASHVLALTFTRRAAGELRQRLAGLGLRSEVAAGTFHGVALAQLRSYWADRGHAAPALLARKGRLMGGVVGGATVTVAQLAGEVEWAKARLVGPDGYADAVRRHRRRTPGPPERIAGLYRAYEEAKRAARMVDLDDVLRLCSHLLETDAAFAAAQRWRFRHLFVDEFQDVNPLQLGLLDAWRGPSTDLCVVGDPHQAIYGWNGADARFLEGFREVHPTADVVVLEGNYRSSPAILAAAADVLRRAGVEERVVRAARPEGPPVHLEGHASEVAEAVAVARAVRDRHAPRAPWSAQAVLVRTHAQAAGIAEALRATGIPHRVRGGQALAERPAIRAAVTLLRRSPGPLAARLPDLATMAEEVASARDHPGDEDGDGAPEDLAFLQRLADDHLRLDPDATTSSFLSWLSATLAAEGAEDGRDAVTVATFHAAKGLEWPIVHLAGLEDGLVPIAHARTPGQRLEEARLLYVAMTRAADELRCTWSAVRTVAGSPVDRQPTPWLRGVARAGRTGSPPPTGPPPDWRRQLAEQRACLAAARPSTTPVLAALQRWREERARAARVEPAALVDDRLLESIAEARPGSHEELAAVPGMGRVLAARLGDGLLEVVAAGGPHG
ncbi:MAG TPA: ATP-dependent DNA helicase UvrD2 [Acidimicrobiales bacterium]|nr:ATP-dependent DNA helicase UvrD2 [Acidimicrobiales bacterium]